MSENQQNENQSVATEAEQVAAPENQTAAENAESQQVAAATGEEASAEGAEVPEENLEQLEGDELLAAVEALLFASGEPISIDRICQVLSVSEEVVTELVGSIKARYAVATAGFELVTVAEKLQFRTKSLFAPYIRSLRSGKPKRLSNPALETLAVIAYRQPVVKSDIEKIRGVDVAPTLKTLLERKLVRIVGHQQSVGQPSLYGTTEEFLKLFGLNALAELPTLRDLQELEREPGESEEEGGDGSEGEGRGRSDGAATPETAQASPA